MINSIQATTLSMVKKEPIKVYNYQINKQQPEPTAITLKGAPYGTVKAYFTPISFMGSAVDPKAELTVDLSRLEQVGKNGIKLDKAFTKYEGTLKQAINGIYDRKNEQGQWLKWIDLPANQMTKAKEIKNYVESSVRNKFDDVVVLGIGGSSLGGKAVISALADSQWNQLSKEQRSGYPRIHFLENIDPDRFSEVVDKLDLDKTLVTVISKSGTTPETSSTFMNLQERMEAKFGDTKEAANHILAITDPVKGLLRSTADQKGYKTFVVPDDVGGRYSVFSDVGLVPAAMVGIDIEQLLEGAKAMSEKCKDVSNLKENPAANQALVHNLLYKKGKDYSVMMPYSDKLSLVSDWYAQLWAESLGKKETAGGKQANVNHSPIKAVGAVDQHSQLQLWREGKEDKVFTLITVDNFRNNVPITRLSKDGLNKDLKYMAGHSINDLIREEAKATMKVLTEEDQRPVMNIKMTEVNPYQLGQLMQMFMIQTAILGELQGLGVNTYLQPAVERGKIIAKEELAK